MTSVNGTPNDPGREAISDRLVRLGRFAWAAFAILTLVLFVRGVPLVVHQVENCAGSSCTVKGLSISPTSPPSISSLRLFAIYAVAMEGASLLILCALSLVLLRRKTDQRIALVAAFMLVGFSGAVFSATIDSTAALGGPWHWGTTFTGFVGSAAIIPFLCMLPDGRFVPYWTRWMACIWLAICVISYYAPPAPILNAASANGTGMPVIAVFFFLALVIAQFTRYRSYASLRQRQQIKWVVGGSFASLACLLVAILGPVVARVNITSLSGNMAGSTLMIVALLMFPASIVMAIVKTHLWDIDRIINRALVYVGLSACLIGVYVGAVLLFERLFNPLTGQSDLAIALSTLVVAALFNPVRHRIQSIVDRRFYRLRYDAERALSRFGLSVRDEVDLNRLTSAMMVVIDETVQPEHASVWLREVETR